jgi:FMN-binding domain
MSAPTLEHPAVTWAPDPAPPARGPLTARPDPGPAPPAPPGGPLDGRFGSGTGAPRSTTAPCSRTVTGPVAQTQWGPVQVELTVSGGRLADVSVLQYPAGNPRDQQINAYALPILVQESLDAQSANIDMVSGATVTSDGHLRSLQGALDEAGL